MRPFVVLQLIRLLRSSGYPGYASNGIKSDSNIERRMEERYTDKYEGHVKFIPDAIVNIVDARKLQGRSIASINWPRLQNQRETFGSGRNGTASVLNARAKLAKCNRNA